MRAPPRIAFAAWLLMIGVTDRAALHAQKESNPVPSSEAEAFHQKGREAGARSHYEEAVALFTQAAALAPDWPYPIYDRAYAYLLMNNDEAALRDYQQTLKLSPRGFFTAHVAVDTLDGNGMPAWPTHLPSTFAGSTLALAADPDPETLGLLKLNKAIVLRSMGRAEEATAILHALVSDRTSTLSNVTWAKRLLTAQ